MISHINTDFFLQLLQSRGGMLCMTTLAVFMLPLSGNIFVKIFNIIGCRIIYQRVSFYYAVLSSVLLNFLITVPVALLVYAFYNLVPFDILYDVVILLFCLEFAGLRRYSMRVNHALRAGDTASAKTSLHPFVLREVSTLSSMGIAKAAVESLPLNFISGWFIPAFWYMVLGANGAFAATIIVILNKSFSPKQPLFSDFGKFNSLLYRTVSLFPVCFLFMVFLFGRRTNIALNCAFNSVRNHPYWLTGLVIGYIAGVMNITLGGPRIYEGTKIRYNRIGLKTEPAPVHIVLTYKKMRNSVFIALLFIVIGQSAWLL